MVFGSNVDTEMIYCPRCDKRITPDHRCLSRRHFFGMLGAAAALFAAKPALLAYDLKASLPDPYVLRMGDRLILNFNGLPCSPSPWTVGLVSRYNAQRGTCTKTDVYGGGEGAFVADGAYTIIGARATVGGRSLNIPITIERSSK